MANWCTTIYKCEGNADDLKELEKAVRACGEMSEPLAENGFGNLWLGCIIKQLGLNVDDYKPCRGEVNDVSCDDGVLTIRQMTAWCEQEGFRKAIESRFPSIKVYYFDTEDMEAWYGTNDREGKYFKAQYVIENSQRTRYYTLDEAVDNICKRLGKQMPHDFDAICKACDEWNKNVPRERRIYARRVEIVD